MRLPVPVPAAALLALLAACGSKSEAHTTGGAPPAACENVVQLPALPDAMVQDLGTVTVGQEASFVVTTGTAAFYIVAQEVGTSAVATIRSGGTTVPNVVVPTNVRSPSGALVYDDWASWPTTTIAGLTYPELTGLLADPGLAPAVGVFSFPNTSRALQTLASAGSVEAGTWRFTVNDWSYECAQSSPTSCSGGNASGRYRVHVVTRPGAIAGGSTLDLEVYLATASGSPLATAALAAVSPQIARWKQSLGFYLQKAGITLRNVTFHDLPAGVKAQYAANGQVNVGASGPCSDVSQLFTSAVERNVAVHVFLADVLVAPIIGGSFQVIGLDGSIPGPSGFPGTVDSGAIVGLEDFGHETTAGACSAGGAPSLGTCGTDRTAYVTAHEIGHWLGLYHTTEQDGTLFDPLADTGSCPCHVCAATTAQASCADVNPSASAPTLLTADRCVGSASCGGGDNLMFWVLSSTLSAGTLSAEQAQVMRLNPAVQ